MDIDLQNIDKIRSLIIKIENIKREIETTYNFELSNYKNELKQLGIPSKLLTQILGARKKTKEEITRENIVMNEILGVL